MKKQYYLAYGSNLNLEQMKQRCPNARKLGAILLNDYQLVYKGRHDFSSYLTVEKCLGYKVPLGLFEISFFDLFTLDYYEGFPLFYTKSSIMVNIDNQTVPAFFYKMKEGYDYHLPSVEYQEECEQGYRDFGFDLSILDRALLDTKRKILQKRK